MTKFDLFLISYAAIGILAGFLFAKFDEKDDELEIAGYMLMGAFMGVPIGVGILAFFSLVYLAKVLSWIYDLILKGGIKS